ncbi:MAG: carbamoyltransferase HypF [Bacteroidota bacterium]
MVRVAETADEKKRRLKITIHGAVQGVGFRPFVFRLAAEMKLKGFVSNTSHGVVIEAEGEQKSLDSFIAKIRSEQPPHAFIQQSQTEYSDPIGYTDFTIRQSDSTETPTAVILPDSAVCDECVNEMFDPENRRYRYPFINCTHCGPRFSIITAIPYDRPNTTMEAFAMCPECEAEYNDPGNRRFHAQPIACPQCGPQIELWDAKGIVLSRLNEAILETAGALREGKIVALKGLGGFQLLADATNDSAVNELRRRKHREEKPFAVMVGSMLTAKALCDVDPHEEILLSSPESPIVLLRRSYALHNPKISIAASVAPGNPYLGLMLPYTPLHHLLMNAIDVPIVATSGNRSDEPICIDEHEALDKLGSIADFFLVHNRPIRRYVDDSIVRVVKGREMILRRARGYAPLPIEVGRAVHQPVLAVGGFLKNTVALQKNDLIFVSQHIGDLETPSALDCFRNTIEDFSKLYHAKPGTVVHDLHPDYSSTVFAQRLPIPQRSVQHHCAHIASCMAEHGLTKPLIGFSWDGTGYGNDGTIWGGECIDFDGEIFSRAATFLPFCLPGGDAAVKDSKRSAAGMLFEIFGRSLFEQKILQEKFTGYDGALILYMMEKKINTPLTSSVGRMFDAVGSLLRLGDRSAFEGQTAMAVEFAAEKSSSAACYPFDIAGSADPKYTIDWRPMLAAIIEEMEHGVSVSDIAKRFHNTLSTIVVSVAQRIGRDTVVLSGGCFQNVLLLEQTIDRLRESGFNPVWHRRIPPNDGGISVGQIYAEHLTHRDL